MALGLLGKKNKQTKKKNKDHVIYLKPRFILNSLLCSYKLSNIVFSFRKKKFLGTKAETLAEKRAGFFAAVCLLVLFCLVNLSLKHSNGFSFLLSNQKLAPAFSSTS